MSDPQDPLRQIGERALEFVPAGGTIGLGTGRAATAFLHALGEKVRNGLRVHGVPTSQASAELATELGIPLVSLEDCGTLDIDVDGADEVDPAGNLIKGYGGALVREKIVASTSRKLVILVGAEKLVARLGERGRLPVEVIPFALRPCREALAKLQLDGAVRMSGGEPYRTDNGNLILDCRLGPIDQPTRLDAALRAIPGVIDSGLFLNMRPTVIIGHDHQIEVRQT